jgi:mono/diheme cytochrome c family protein
MKTIWKILLIAVIVIVAGIAGLIGYVKLILPRMGAPPDIKVEMTAEKIARGKYLANHVAVCMDCHSRRDWNKFAGPVISGSFGAGGEVFDHNAGFPGSIISRNITPAGIGNWTDGELFRTITTGVNKDGKALFPVMPYFSYGRADEEDIKAIIAYIRTLSPIENKVPPSKYDFPVNLIINTIPKEAALTHMPDRSDQTSYGKYLVNFAACTECHTPVEKNKPIPGMEYTGGWEFMLPTGGVVRSMNLTADMKTGIGGWTKDVFVGRFKTYRDTVFIPYAIQPKSFNTIMPWLMYSGMSEEDLGYIFDFLRTLKPVEHKVEKFSPGKI